MRRRSRLLAARSITTVAGELVLIMVAVLAALWVDNWRQGIVARTTEQGYVERLLRDLRTDSVTIADAIQRSEFAAEALVRLATMIDGDTLGDPGSYYWDLALSRGYFERQIGSGKLVTQGTFDDLVATGSLKLMPPAVVDRIRNYYSTAYPGVRSLEDFYAGPVGEYLRLVRGLTPPELIESLLAGATRLEEALASGVDAGVITDPHQAADALVYLRSQPGLAPLMLEMARIQRRMALEYKFLASHGNYLAGELRRRTMSGT